MKRPRHSTQAGFTMTELVVVIAIIGILAAFAAPSMTKLLTTQKVRSTSYDLFADLTYARSEAIARGRNVTMQSASGGADWAGGWQIWDNTAAPPVKLRDQSAIAAGVVFTADQAALVFDRTGRTSAIANFNIAPVDPAATIDQKRCVHIDPSGRPRTAQGAC
ncbi:MAG TPA: GspH/FimT family pseudopilin [Usitatibacter sp.]|nr:GspH/FimT family pseudopilin [Usitatibacter sp.]